jgi:hypothetical protein
MSLEPDFQFRQKPSAQGRGNVYSIEPTLVNSELKTRDSGLFQSLRDGALSILRGKATHRGALKVAGLKTIHTDQRAHALR